MKSKSIIILALILLVVGATSFVAVNGIELGDYKVVKAKDSIDLGLDLAGGVYVVLEANTEVKGAELQTGKNVRNSEVNFQTNSLGVQEPVVSLEFDAEGTANFAEVTTRLAAVTSGNREDKIIFIVLDDQVISFPAVGEPIRDGKAVISGGFQLDEANHLSTLIRAGALPVEMVELQTSVIGPTLGLEAYEKSILAGGIALLIIFLFMIAVYKLPGVVASIALLIYVLITIGTMAGLGVKLTLPGIAGLILSIGMAVDANVIIFERIREEIKLGKTIRTSIDVGFHRALSSVLDSNITTLIAGVVLYYFGIGPIKGFGVTLIIGIVASMITAVFLTKYLLKLMASITGGKNTKLYGV